MIGLSIIAHVGPRHDRRLTGGCLPLGGDFEAAR